MKGLLIKDFCLLKNQKRVLPIVLLLAVWFTVMHQDSFAFTFIGMMMTILAVGTHSYDEVNNGFTFLFTLPFSRRTYVKEKFVLTGILLFLGMIVSFVCLLVAKLVEKVPFPVSEVGLTVVLTVAVCLISAAVLIPVRIRYGSESGRIIFMVVFGVMAMVLVLIGKLLPAGSEEKAAQFFAGLSPAVLFAALAVAVVVILLIGYRVSVKWIEKKEY